MRATSSDMSVCRRRRRFASHCPSTSLPGDTVQRGDPHPAEQALIEAVPALAEYISALKEKGRKVPAFAMRQLFRLLQEYPRESFLAAIAEAAQYGLYDLDRVERMILRRIAREYFLLGGTEPDSHE